MMIFQEMAQEIRANWRTWRLIPQDRHGRKITLLMLVPVALVYIGRIAVHQGLEYERGPFGSMWWVICPLVVCPIAVGLMILVLRLAAIAVRSAQHFAPAIVLLGGTALALFLPLPLLPLPVYPEEEFFIAHRAEFDEVVSLAHQDKLLCLWNLGCDVFARDLPPEYEYLSRDDYVAVYQRNPSGFSVRFNPITFSYPIIYFEIPADVNHPSNRECQGTSSVRKLDEHWYLCVEDWN